MRSTLLHTVATSLAVLTIGASLATTPVLAAARHGGGGAGGSHHIGGVHRGGGYYGGCKQGYYNQGCGPGIAGGNIGDLLGQ
jgi:hypothetical protein